MSSPFKCFAASLLIAWIAVPSAHAQTATECTASKFCYCVNTAMKDTIEKQVDAIRGMIEQQKKEGKSVGYMSIPLSTLGGSLFNVNSRIAADAKGRIEERFGQPYVWVLNPAANEMSLPQGATGADYMLMWTRVLEGKNDLGEDFDFVYFVGPSDFARHFGLDGQSDMKKLEAYFEELLKTDTRLQQMVKDNRIDKKSFRNYYALRASVSFSLGAHDEWNIIRFINELRRDSKDFGIGRQLPVLFDGRAVAPGGLESAVAAGNSGECKRS